MMSSAPDLEEEDEIDGGHEMADLESDFEDSSDGMSAILSDGDGNEEESIEDETFNGEDLAAMEFEEANGPVHKGVPLPATDLGPSSDVGKNEKERRRRMKQLPTFASASDYAKMLDDDEGEDLG